MPDSTTLSPPASAAPDAGNPPADDAFSEAAILERKLGLKLDAPPAAEPVKTDPVPAGDPPKTEPVNPNHAAAARRVEGKHAQNKALEEAQARLKQLEDENKTRLAELESTRAKVAEIENLKSGVEAKLTETEQWYREKEVIPKVDLHQLPEVKAAHERWAQGGYVFLPNDISTDGESAMRLKPEQLGEERLKYITGIVDAWAKTDANDAISSLDRQNGQHVQLTNIALALGVGKNHLTSEVEHQGKRYAVIDPTHRVYRHLSRYIADYAAQKAAYVDTVKKAHETIFDSAGKITRQRTNESAERYRAAGLGLSGADLTAALAKDPGNPTLRIMKAAEEAGLADEVKTAIEREAHLNGHRRFSVEPVEADPQKRTALAQALHERDQARLAAAPLNGVTQKLLISHMDEVARLKAENQKLAQERDLALAAGEPTSGSGGESQVAGEGKVADLDPWSPEAIIARNPHGLLNRNR